MSRAPGSVPSRPPERGAALAFVVLLMLSLLALAHGVLIAALSERSASRAAVRELRRRAASEYALAETLSRAAGTWMDGIGVWQTARETLPPLGTLTLEGEVRRLGPESWLAQGVARDSTGVEARTLRLTWAADPLTRVEGLPAMVTLAPGVPVLVDGSLDASAPAAIEAPLRAVDCDPWQPDLATRYGSAPLPAVAPAADSTAPLALGLLAFDRLLGAASVTVTGAGTPAPSEALGACRSAEPWMWGDPDEPTRPCGADLPLRGAAGDLRVMGGAGQGLLVVDGDLTLEGTRFYGLVLVRGTLRLTGGARLEGMALARDGLEVGAGSGVRASACWAVRVLAAHRDVLGGFLPVSEAQIGPT